MDHPPKTASERYEDPGYVAHDYMLEMLVRVYLFAPHIKEEDLLDFFGYAEFMCFTFIYHHHLEEHIIYPQFTEATNDPWTSLCDDYDDYLPPIHALWHYIRSSRFSLAGSPPHPKSFNLKYLTPLEEIDQQHKNFLNFSNPELGYDGLAVQKLLEGVLDRFLTHLPAELEMSTAKNVQKIDPKQVDAVLNAVRKEAYTNSAPLMLSGFRTGIQVDELNRFLGNAGFIVRQAFFWVPYLLGSQYNSWWRFAPYPEQTTWSGKA